MAIRRIIVDLDVGTDDAFALLVLLYADKMSQIKIEAIVCTMGNASLNDVCKNVIRLLELFGRTEIPVFKGASSPIIPLDNPQPENFHGADGFGDLQHDKEPDTSIIRNVPAAVAIHDLLLKAPGEITLVCIGPLTNAALAMRIFDDFAQNLRDIYIMGGSYTEGNVTEFAEFNFYTDPESANMVLNNSELEIKVVTWETCLASDITFNWRYSILGKHLTPFMDLINKAERNIYESKTVNVTWRPCDAFLVIAMLYPEVIVHQSKHNATVELHHEKRRGQMILDYDNDKTKNNWRYSILGKNLTPFMDLINKAERNVYESKTVNATWYPCDAFLVIAMLYPEVIVHQSRHSATVELHHEKRRGQMILDSDNGKTKNVTIIEKLNIDLVKNVLLEASTGIFN